jgi:hypothetical protein
MRRRALFFAILIYVTLDLSLPSIPGAFVFEPADSVESTQINRGRGAVEAGVLPPLARELAVLPEPCLDVSDRLASTGEVAPRGHSVVNWLPRAIHDPAPSSEDPH